MDLLGAEPHERRNPAGRRRDIQLAGAMFAGGVAMFWAGVYSRAPEPRALLLIPLAVACTALLFRRTAPLPALIAGSVAFAADLALGLSLATVIVYAELIYDTSLYGRPWFGRRVLWIMSAAAVAIAAGVLVRLPLASGVSIAVNAGLVLVLPVLTAIEVRGHRDRAAAEKLRADQLERLAELDRQQALAAERARMARELHDVIANHLSAIAINATGARVVGGERLDPQVANALAVIRENSVQGLAEMRQMIELLRDPDGVEEPIRPRLEELQTLIRYAQEAGLQATLDRTGAPARPLPVAVDLAAYRIVQESLTNAAKHAAGGTVAVRIHHRAAGIAVTIDSTPKIKEKPSSVPGSGVGLLGMRERVTLLGGAFEAGPHGGGFRVHAELPA
jgi:signal transduction histidine kinase